MKTYIISFINSKVALLSALFTEVVVLGTQPSAKWRDLGERIYCLSSFSQRYYLKKNTSSSKCSPKLSSRLKKFGEYLVLKLSFSRDTMDLSLMSGGLFFFKLIIIKAIQTYSRKNKQRSRQTKTNKLRRDFFPVAEVYSRIENSWKEPHQFLHIPGIDPDSRA